MSILYPDLDLTDFPQKIDTFQQWLDITASDGPLVKQYMEAVKNGDTEQANQILQRIPSGAQKILKANDLNKLTQAMLAVERFYKTDVQGYVAQKQAEWEAIINQFVYKDLWSSGVSYERNNIVSYINFGLQYLYIAIKDVPAGTAPTNEQYWRMLTIRGLQGISGVGLSYRNQWEAPAEYRVDDAVTYDGALWMALKPSKGVTPVQGSSSWRLIMTLSSVAYPIQPTEPSNQSEGDLWFNTQGAPTEYYHLVPLRNPASASDIANGKQAYDYLGNVIVGTGSIGGSGAEWNDGSQFIWN